MQSFESIRREHSIWLWVSPWWESALRHIVLILHLLKPRQVLPLHLCLIVQSLMHLRPRTVALAFLPVLPASAYHPLTLRINPRMKSALFTLILYLVHVLDQMLKFSLLIHSQTSLVLLSVLDEFLKHNLQSVFWVGYRTVNLLSWRF